MLMAKSFAPSTLSNADLRLSNLDTVARAAKTEILSLNQSASSVVRAVSRVVAPSECPTKATFD